MIIQSKELSGVRSDHPDQTIALRLGCYDVLHSGHQEGIDVASAIADILVIGVMPDAYVRSKKGQDRPMNPIEKRIEAIDAAEEVDYSFVAEAGRIALARTLLKLRPNAYIEGKEHASGYAKTVFLAAIGAEYVIDDKKHASSSAIISTFGSDEALRLSSLEFHPPVLGAPKASAV